MEMMGKITLGQENFNSTGSISLEKTKMLDITRDKPIKVAVRVAVPVRDHPKFNFVGKLLGPKGNSLKRLQEETMCKMAVLGRGSMKDRKKEEELRASGDPRYTHLFDDLHVEISTFAAPAEAHARIAYALAEVRRFLVPDYHDDIRQEQMWEMQALSSTQNQNVDPNNSNSSSPDNGKSCDMDSSTDCLSNTINASERSESDLNLNANIEQDTNMQIDVGQTNLLASTNNIIPTTAALASVVTLPSETTERETIFVEASGGLLHPALRGIKAVNIGGSLARKRPLLGVPRTGMNPTKRTVMTLLARAKNSQILHGVRGGIKNPIDEPVQMITSPLILQ